MDKYAVYISPQAYKDIDEIYTYIESELFAPDTALNLVGEILTSGFLIRRILC